MILKHELGKEKLKKNTDKIVMTKKRTVAFSGSISFRTNGANGGLGKRKQYIRLEKIKCESGMGESLSGIMLAIDGQGFSRLPKQGRELLCDESAECVILGHLRKFFGFRQGPRLKAGMAVEVLSIEGNIVRTEPDELLSGLLHDVEKNEWFVLLKKKGLTARHLVSIKAGGKR